VSLMPVFPPMLLAMLIAGGADAIVDVAAETLIQRRSPDEVRSRVVAAVDGLILTMFATSFLFAGFVVAALGPKAAYAIAGAGCVVTATLLVPLLRERTGSPLPRTVADPP
jgi:MFS family permease